MLKMKGASNNELTEKMIIEVDVLGALVVHGIGAKKYCTLVVTKKKRSVS